MSVVEGLRHSGLSRVGLLALIVLGYLVYLAGVLLEARDHLLTAFPVVEVGGATAALIVGLLFVQWFFVREAPEAEAEADEA